MTHLRLGNRVASDLLDLREGFDRIFHQIFKSQGYPVAAAENYFAVVPPMQTWIDTNRKEFHVSLPLPGIRPEALNVTFQGKQLIVSGEWEDPKNESGKKYFAREFYFDRFERMIEIPEGVDTEKLTAELTNGVLEIMAPMIPAALPRKIEIKDVKNVAATKAMGSAK